MVVLRNFEKEDAFALHKNRYADTSVAHVQDLIGAWNIKQVNNKYFEMFGIWCGEKMVGTVSLYQLSTEVISIGPEIFCDYRRNGFAKEAMMYACEIAKEKGYRIVSQQIRTDNDASIALHTSLGFETDGLIYTNAKGSQVSVYLKCLV